MRPHRLLRPCAGWARDPRFPALIHEAVQTPIRTRVMRTLRREGSTHKAWLQGGALSQRCSRSRSIRRAGASECRIAAAVAVGRRRSRARCLGVPPSARGLWRGFVTVVCITLAVLARTPLHAWGSKELKGLGRRALSCRCIAPCWVSGGRVCRQPLRRIGVFRACNQTRTHGTKKPPSSALLYADLRRAQQRGAAPAAPAPQARIIARRRLM